MSDNDPVKVLISGTDLNFAQTLQGWIEKENLEVTVDHQGKPDTWVTCSMKRPAARSLYLRLAKTDLEEPFFVDAVFPASATPSPKTVLWGPARRAQEELLANLPPMTATPDVPASQSRKVAPARNSPSRR